MINGPSQRPRSSSTPQATSPTHVQSPKQSESESAALGTSRPDEPAAATFELPVQEVLSQDEVTLLKGCLQTWKSQDKTQGESRRGDVNDFDRRVLDDAVQVDGKNIIFISNGEPPGLPPALAAERDAQGNVVREARVTFVYPQPGFGQIEARESVEHKGEYDGKSQGQPMPWVTTSSGAAVPSFIVTPASPQTTSPDSSSAPHTDLASTSPRGSANLSVSRGSASKLFKQLFRQRKPDNVAEISPETKLGIEPLPVAAQATPMPAAALRVPMSPAQWRRDYPDELANKVMSNPKPLIGDQGMPQHLRRIKDQVFVQIGELVALLGNDFKEDDAAAKLANTIMDRFRAPEIPAALALDCMKELALRVVAAPALPGRTYIFSEMSRLMGALEMHVDQHDPWALDLHAYLSHLSANLREQ